MVSGASRVPRSGFYPPSALPRSLAGSDKMQQISIESSVVTESHYDASFETEVGMIKIKMITVEYILETSYD